MGLLDRPGQSQRYGLLSPDVMSLIQSGGPRVAQAPAAPRRDRVSGWRVFDRVLGGQTVTEGLDAERARLETEAMRPQMLARQAAARQAAERMGPAAMLAYDLNPEKFGENLAEQYAPRTTSAGGRTDIMGTGQSVAAPSYTTVNDTVFLNDPLTGASTVNATAPPAFSDTVASRNADTAAFNARNPVLPANSTWVGENGQPRAQGYIAPEVVSTPAGGTTNVFDAQGNVINAVQGNARPLTSMDRRQAREDQDAIQTSESINANLDNLISQIDGGQLNLGPMTNLMSQGLNAAGASNQNSRNFASFRASLEKLRNDSLRLNAGVQTDGDSRRAWDELVANINDERVVAQRLAEIRDINQRAIEYRRARLADAAPETQAPAAPAGGPRPGQVENGYQFLGGDPASPSSWRRVQ